MFTSYKFKCIFYASIKLFIINRREKNYIIIPMAQSPSIPQFSKLSLTNVLLTPRMLLLESLQSNLLRCKLLEHLLDYACPVKTSLPMSLSLLLHFMKNCTLAPDPTVNITLVSCLHLYLIDQTIFPRRYLCFIFGNNF